MRFSFAFHHSEKLGWDFVIIEFTTVRIRFRLVSFSKVVVFGMRVTNVQYIAWGIRVIPSWGRSAT